MAWGSSVAAARGPSASGSHWTLSRVAFYTCAAGVGVLGLRVTWRLVRLFSHREEILPWLSSVVPPMDYDYKQDVEPKETVEKRFPALADLVANGTLCVLRPPHDFDRALPDELLVLGTAHVSRRTAEAVYRTIVEVEPDACIVELCKSRSFMLYREVPPSMYQLDAAASSSAAADAAAAPGQPQPADASPPAQPASAATPDATQQAPPAPRRQGQGEEPGLASQLSSLVQALKTHSSPLQALLSWAYAKVEQQLDTVAGLEFIRAWHAIQEVERRRKARAEANQQQPAEGNGAMRATPGPSAPSTSYSSVEVYLGDVPLQRTLSRIWGVLGVRQKLRLVYTLVRDCLTLEADDGMLEQLLEEDMLELMQRELGGAFPEILGPLLHERNWQLAHTVHNAAQHGNKRVVLVIGRGHVPGVVYCLMQPYRARKSFRVPSADLTQLAGPAAPPPATAALP